MSFNFKTIDDDKRKQYDIIPLILSKQNKDYLLQSRVLKLHCNKPSSYPPAPTPVDPNYSETNFENYSKTYLPSPYFPPSISNFNPSSNPYYWNAINDVKSKRNFLQSQNQDTPSEMNKNTNGSSVNNIYTQEVKLVNFNNEINIPTINLPWNPPLLLESSNEISSSSSSSSSSQFNGDPKLINFRKASIPYNHASQSPPLYSNDYLVHPNMESSIPTFLPITEPNLPQDLSTDNNDLSADQINIDSIIEIIDRINHENKINMAESEVPNDKPNPLSYPMKYYNKIGEETIKSNFKNPDPLKVEHIHNERERGCLNLVNIPQDRNRIEPINQTKTTNENKNALREDIPTNSHLEKVMPKAKNDPIKKKTRLMINGSKIKIDEKTGIVMRSYINEFYSNKPFKCRFCYYSFKRKYDLIRHTRLHTGEKPFVCERCHKKFYRSDQLNYHRKSNSCYK